MNELLRMAVAGVLAMGCTSAERAQGGHSQHEGEKPGEHASEKPGEREAEVHLTPEAIERAGIRLAPAERRALTGGVAIPAEVQFDPTSTAHVGPLAPGRIIKVNVGLGDPVRQGQLLGVVASSDVSTARSRLEQVRARLSAAESAWGRQKQLSAEGIGARRSLIEAEAQVGELQAEVQGLQRQLAVLGSGRAGELSLTAPIAGVVVGLHGTLGETATPEEPMFIITDPTRVWVQGNVPELEIGRVESGSAALVRVHAFPELKMTGTITYVAPALEDESRSLPIRVTLQAPDARLRSGLYGSIELIGGKVDDRVLVVPVDAVATLNGQTIVFVPADEPHAFRAQPVALGRRAGGFFEVRSGLQEGAQLAVSGAFTLKSTVQSGELSEGHSH